jgi:predicted transcriptional regulator
MGKAEFTDRELDLMSVLWRLGSGTVSEVREALGEEVGYTSVLKMLQILEEKGHVRHEGEGRAYRYFPKVKPEEAGRTALGRIVNKIFHGSAELTLARLVEERPISSKELERMKRILDELGEAQPRDEGPAAKGPKGRKRRKT